MGRTKGSTNRPKTITPKTEIKSPPKEKPPVRKVITPPKTEFIAVQPIEAPLLLCRRCQSAFETQEDYQLHACQIQIYAVDEENPETESYEIAEIADPQEDDGEVVHVRVEEESPSKKPRKPYKKRESSSPGDKLKKKDKGPVQCETCNKTFTRKYHLERHLIHTSCNPGHLEREELSCEVCGKVFTRIDNLRMHLRAHLGQKTRSRDFPCPFCEKSFSGSSLLNIHVRTHTKEKPYLCDWDGCGKGFPSSGALTKHRRVHTGERPYECPQCGNRFAAKETLNRHVRTHTGRRDHKCTICGKAFIQNTQLKAHMFYHNSEFALTCDLCGKQFNRKTRLREHVDFVHLKRKMPSCNICEKKFMRREDLNRHIDIHVGERTHACPECNKKFVTKAAVRIHMRVHQIEPPALCSYCNKTFLRIDCLVRHMRTKHREVLKKIIVEAETKKIIKTLGNAEYEIVFCGDDTESQATEEVFELMSVKGEDDVVEDDDAPIFLDDDVLKKYISELLQIVIEEKLLNELGFGKKPVDEVLCSVIEQCSKRPIKKTDEDDASSSMRENAKILFAMVLDEDHIKSLLNNYTVDEVITIVLRMAKEN